MRLRAADKAAAVYVPAPSAHSRQAIRTVLCCLQMDTPQMWQDASLCAPVDTDVRYTVADAAVRLSVSLTGRSQRKECHYCGIRQFRRRIEVCACAVVGATLMRRCLPCDEWDRHSSSRHRHLSDSCPAHAETDAWRCLDASLDSS